METAPIPGEFRRERPRARLLTSAVGAANVGSLLRWLCGGLLVAGLVYRIADAGPLTLAAPRTALTLTQPGLEDIVVFFQHVERRVPPGRSVAVIPAPRHEIASPLVYYYLALGQLPRHRVLYAESPHFPGPAPDYVASFRAPVDDPRLELVAKLPQGFVYRRVP